MADKEITDKADAVKNQRKTDNSIKKQTKKKSVKKKSAKKKVVKKKIVKKKSVVKESATVAKKAEQKQAAPPKVDAESSAIARQADSETVGNAPSSPAKIGSNNVERGITTPPVSTQNQSNREEHETMSATNAQSQSTAAKGAMGFWPKTLIWIIIVIAGFMYIRSLAEREQTAATPEEQVSSSPETMQTAVEPATIASSGTSEQAKTESTPVEPAVVIPSEPQQTVTAPAQLPVAEAAIEAPPAEEQKPGPLESVGTTVPVEVHAQPEAPIESATISEPGVDEARAVTVEKVEAGMDETAAAETPETPTLETAKQAKPEETVLAPAVAPPAESVAETATADPASSKEAESTESPTTEPVVAEQAQPAPAETSSEEQSTEESESSRPSFRERFGYKRPGSPYRSSRFSRPSGPMGYGDQSAVEGDEAGFPPRQPASRMYGPGPMGYGRGYGYPSNSGYGYPSNQGYGYGYGGYSPYNQGPGGTMGYPGVPVR